MFIRIKNRQNNFATGIVPVHNFSLKIIDDSKRMIINAEIKEDSFNLLRVYNGSKILM